MRIPPAFVPVPPSVMQKPNGIACNLQHTVVYLPLEKLHVRAEIVDVSATVTLTQTFWQCSPLSASRAKYVFPVPARAAVCGFEMRTEDGRSITAVAKEREEAQREHEQAIQQGMMTGLVEHVTDDVFTISLGSLPSLQMITTKLTYVLDLMDDNLSDQIRFQLPICVGARYGTLPAGMREAKNIPPERISITTEVYMKGAIQSITSPSHSTLNILPDTGAHVASPVRRRVAEFRSPSFLSRDFVLSIKAEGLDSPRCFAQRGSDGSIAMQLTMVPKFDLPILAKQEYIFVVDRSGSMRGDRIETAKRTLVMLLRALPSRGTTFNIYSFGSHCDSLWRESVEYASSTLEEATRHIDGMSANYGGTEIRAALEEVFQYCSSWSPTACFVLTDGEAYDNDRTFDTVTKAVDGAKEGAKLRVFTLGIGETASTATCEGIARAGNGVCLMATTSESIIAKCSKLVKASRTEILRNVSVDWGIPRQLMDNAEKADVQNAPFRQAPSTLSSIYAGNRFIVFALIQDEKIKIPSEVVIRALRESGEELKFGVSVEEISSIQHEPKRPLIHTLAARRLITDLEDRNREYAPFRMKAAIVHLGEQYQLASQYTSFIAVEERSQESLLSPVDHLVGGYPSSGSSQYATAGLFGNKAPAPTSYSAGPSLFGGPAQPTTSFGQPGMPQASPSNNMFGASSRSSFGGTSLFGASAIPTARVQQDLLGMPPGQTTGGFGSSSGGTFSFGTTSSFDAPKTHNTSGFSIGASAMPATRVQQDLLGMPPGQTTGGFGSSSGGTFSFGTTFSFGAPKTHDTSGFSIGASAMPATRVQQDLLGMPPGQTTGGFGSSSGGTFSFGTTSSFGAPKTHDTSGFSIGASAIPATRVQQDLLGMPPGQTTGGFGSSSGGTFSFGTTSSFGAPKTHDTSGFSIGASAIPATRVQQDLLGMPPGQTTGGFGSSSGGGPFFGATSSFGAPATYGTSGFSLGGPARSSFGGPAPSGTSGFFSFGAPAIPTTHVQQNLFGIPPGQTTGALFGSLPGGGSSFGATSSGTYKTFEAPVFNPSSPPRAPVPPMGSSERHTHVDVGDTSAMDVDEEPTVAAAASLPVEQQILQLVRLQSFDGSFPTNAQSAQILGFRALGEAHKYGVDATVWATVLAVAWFQLHLEKHPELLEGLLEKASEFIRQRPGVDFDALLEKAKIWFPERDDLQR